ncbi:hypothetical protein QSU92_00975 [Microbacterium sp. ET2]|uniref:hypothetical protein n=1 Tax=Microbacterium albipurpureum TaxID=3050384 RepID=UPI00259C94D2|nr:hypothetical protein [Microbacterium sp. ET2 (Ac-2212)]WJL95833.1 hypothetical protein QSU92_00975 [Microbacterium sp. ET2 (Ac-2212)]
MTSALRRLFVGGAFAVALLALTACAGETADAEPSGAPSPAASSPVAEPSAAPTEEPAAAADPTCETIIPETTVADYDSVGWSAQASPFTITGEEVPGGIECVWANFDGPASDQLHIYGWAPIDEATADEARERLEAEGWTVEADPAGVYVTEPAETAVATDENGYGITYFFEAGTVKIADTKQSILLIEWG